MTIGDKIKGVDVLRALANGYLLRAPNKTKWRVQHQDGDQWSVVRVGRNWSRTSRVSIPIDAFVDGREFEVVE